MSLIKQIKDLESQIAAMQGQLTDAHAQVEDVTKAHAAVLAEKDTQIGALTADLEAANALINESNESMQTMVAQADAATKKNEEITAAKVAHEEKIATLTKALADPAYAAAMAQGETPVEGSGEPSEKMTREQANAAYEAITDSAARDKFRVDHKEELGL